MRSICNVFLTLLIVSVASPLSARAAQEAAPAIQLPPDQKAYQAADAIVDRQQRINALEMFLRDYPSSQRADSARHQLLDLLLDVRPQDTRKVDALAKSIIDHSTPEDLADNEDSVAHELAEALPKGVDLKSAQKWSEDALKHTTLTGITEEYRAYFVKYKYPMPSPEVLHRTWQRERAVKLQTLSDIYLHEGKLAESSGAVDEALKLDPRNGATYVIEGEIAHVRHQDRQALDSLEQAETFGGMTVTSEALLRELYMAQHGGDISGLDTEIDRRYRSLPEPFSVTTHTGAPTGRTVLLELFTGSACLPCIAGDLATDGVLKAYPRSEVVVLSFELQRTGPDPLANPDSEARAAYDNVQATPVARMDGDPQGILGGPETKAEQRFDSLQKAIDAELAKSSGVSLQLAANFTPEHLVAATARVEISDALALKKTLTTPLAEDESGRIMSEMRGLLTTSPKPEATSRLVLNFALVEKEVRYSGENGVRFHSMVVRSMAKPSELGFPVSFTGVSGASASFDPAAISEGLSAYLTAFEKHNTRFAVTHFLMKDTHLPLQDLAVVAWVEDPVTHHVVAAAYVPLNAPAQEASR